MSRTLLISGVFPPQPGGSGRWMHELYRRMPRDRVVIAAGEHPAQAAFDELQQMHIERLPLKLRSWGCIGWQASKDYWNLVQRLKRLVRANNVTSVHSVCVLPEGLAAWCLKRSTGIPYMTYFHGEELQIVAGSRELTWLTKRVLSGASLLIANSHNTARILRDEWAVPDHKLRVLNPGVDTQRFVPAERDEDVRAALGWSGRTIILTVGRLQPRKGQDMLIRALPAIAASVPNVLYSIVGDGDDRARLEQLTDDLGVRALVQFRGEPRDQDLVRCYQQCDLFALPNRTVDGDIEGFGMVLVEAQACGKAVLAGDSGGTRETMQIPETGRIVNCEQPQLLADGLIDLLQSAQTRTGMGLAARRWVEDEFDWESLVVKAAEYFKLGGLTPVDPRMTERAARQEVASALSEAK